jgi:hypothetical protein
MTVGGSMVGGSILAVGVPAVRAMRRGRAEALNAD